MWGGASALGCMCKSVLLCFRLRSCHIFKISPGDAVAAAAIGVNLRRDGPDVNATAAAKVLADAAAHRVAYKLLRLLERHVWVVAAHELGGSRAHAGTHSGVGRLLHVTLRRHRHERAAAPATAIVATYDERRLQSTLRQLATKHARDPPRAES
eukprot:CAMPEP_0118874060 /NCGR_PEP_ID=MMETSP1163-20130328/15639_1 /TAXON_ID=124430 /ORGANISM="Phaeomonas parva, Strain CCMP2877" /LENGTH=153 /DNA_ID=CAMNT_0006809399 /DNA_START=1079 /DNA_END=1537 /DNA_ORIENTATION=+